MLEFWLPTTNIFYQGGQSFSVHFDRGCSEMALEHTKGSKLYTQYVIDELWDI